MQSMVPEDYVEECKRAHLPALRKAKDAAKDAAKDDAKEKEKSKLDVNVPALP